MTDPAPPCAVGDRIRLLAMPNDPDPIPYGTEGTVTRVQHLWQDNWQVEVDWDIPRSLRLALPMDVFEIIQPAELGAAT